MSMYNVTCEGPGPHAGDGTGILGQSDRETSGMRCSAEACQPAPAEVQAPTAEELQAQLDAIAAQLAALQG